MKKITIEVPDCQIEVNLIAQTECNSVSGATVMVDGKPYNQEVEYIAKFTDYEKWKAYRDIRFPHFNNSTIIFESHPYLYRSGASSYSVGEGEVEITQDEFLAKFAPELLEEPKYIEMPEGWVDVKKRLPKSGKCVLIYSKNGGVAEGCFKNPGFFWEQWRWNATLTDEVTHWMQMPEPPCE